MKSFAGHAIAMVVITIAVTTAIVAAQQEEVQSPELETPFTSNQEAALRDYQMVCTHENLAHANAIVKENCKAGSPPSEWDINGFGDPSIQGFAVDISVNVGDTARFKIDSQDADGYKVDIYRLGYYQGHGARLVHRIHEDGLLVHVPHEQPDCRVDDATLEYSCKAWKVTAEWDVPADAVPGYYVARPTRTDTHAHPPATWRADNSQVEDDARFVMKGMEGVKPPRGPHKYGANGLGALRNPIREPRASHIYFIVRDDASHADVVMQASDTVWQAYNHFGGTCTYGSYNPAAPRPRCYKASYDRPLRTRETRPANAPLGSELPMIQFLESKGFDVTYIAGVDTDRLGTARLLQHKLFLSVGHDEYWSQRQRDNVQAARDRGMHLAFLSGNEMFWRIRWEDDFRTMVVYKETQHPTKLDPEPREWTGTYRDARDINPLGAQPENEIIGQLFTLNAWRNDPLIVPRRFASLKWWRGTAVERLQHKYDPARPFVAYMRGVLGHEMDEDLDNGFRPPGVVHLSETHVDNVMYVNDYGSTYDSGHGVHRLTLYKNQSSGAIVWGAGTCQWSWALAPMHDSESGLPAPQMNMLNTRVGVDVFSPVPDLQQLTLNIFHEMGAKPTTLQGTRLTSAPLAPVDADAPECFIETVFVEQEGGGAAARRVMPDSVDGRPERVAKVVVEAWDKSGGSGVIAGVEVSIDEHHQRWHPAFPISAEPLAQGGAAATWEAEVPLRHFFGADIDDETKHEFNEEVHVGISTRARCRATDDSLNTQTKYGALEGVLEKEAEAATSGEAVQAESDL